MKPLNLAPLLMSLALAACGGGGGDSPAPSAGPDVSPGAASGDLTSGVTAIQNPTAITEIQPAPASIGADVPATYFGTAPSTVQKELVGPYQLLKAGTLDEEKGRLTLPLYKGRLASGETVWYILTDTDDEANAAALGINFSSKLSYAAVGRGVRHASQQLIDGETVVVFESGRVDFSPVHAVTPGAEPHPFPPSAFQPGSVGDADYSPLAMIGGHVYNAPIVAFGTPAATLDAFCNGNADYHLVHDKVVSICPRDRVVTLALTTGFSFGRPVLYLSTEASHALPAAMEGATLAPGLVDIKVGNDDTAFSAVERLFAVVNGASNDVAGEVHPQRQGFDSALRGDGGPLNVLGGIPTVATDYSPLWDLNVGEWTASAVSHDYRARLTGEFEFLGNVQRGFLTGPGGGPFGSTGFIVNCPIVSRFL
ncbi:hypothetical protein [Derxia gummosa]|uniref:Uncharacterized protein n=1 Tax=Derxia gummosa DSM 723 TaxID=1121388 RepID=A0A8B6X9E5_9BURK|nr:hypothetical protein [Derxia gummosa]